jgi:uncharacterized membrane protein
MQAKIHTNRVSYIDEKVGLERLVFFSDAVFAIAITLLALEIRLPGEATNLTDQELLTSLLQIWPRYLSFIISFLVIAHHHRFSLIGYYDNRLLLLNLLFLMSVAFIPFPTSVISENGNHTATVFYALSIATTGLLSALVWWYASQDNRLINKGRDKQLSRRTLFSILTVPAVFLFSIVLTLMNPTLGKLSWILTIPAALLFKINRNHII